LLDPPLGLPSSKVIRYDFESEPQELVAVKITSLVPGVSVKFALIVPFKLLKFVR